jgi:hypothetical protein
MSTGDSESSAHRRRREGPRDPATDPSLCGHWPGTNGDFHRNRAGERCSAQVIDGTHNCRSHPGMPLAKLRAKGAVVVELRNWGLTSQTDLVDPGETLLKLVTQSAARADMYAGFLAAAVDAADRLRASGQAPESDLLAEETARLDLERIFNHGAVAALVGHTYAGTQTSGVIATGEKIRGLAELEAQERDRCAGFAAKAVAAGLAERMVKLAERQGALLATILVGALEDLGVQAGEERVRQVLGARIAAATGAPLVLEGKVA